MHDKIINYHKFAFGKIGFDSEPPCPNHDGLMLSIRLLGGGMLFLIVSTDGAEADGSQNPWQPLNDRNGRDAAC